MRVVDGGQARRAGELDQVHEHREHDRTAHRRGEVLRLHDPPNARVQPGLRRLRDGERRAATEREEVLHVEGADSGRDEAEPDLDGSRIAEEEEHVQPGGHEREVNDAAHGDERPGDEEHLGPAVEVHEQSEHEEQDPHRARVDAIDQAERHREEREAEVADVEAAEPRQLDRSARRRRSCPGEQRADAHVGHSRPKADDQLPTHPEGGHAESSDARAGAEVGQPRPCRGIVLHVADRELERRPLPSQRGEE
jgi:hypothetical protein